VFQPLTTARLVVRAVVASDVDALHARRNEPEVARLQAWLLPWPREDAERIVADSMALDGPTDGHWWTLTIEERDSGAVVGDLVLNLSNGGRTGEVGYSLGSRWWGRGYAVEALDALVDWVLARYPVSRLEGRLHPQNRASAMVLERTGFLFEGHTRLSFWLGEDNSDDWIYGLTRADRAAWRDRSRTPPEEVRLVPITPANAAAALALRTHHSQQAFVAPMLHSFADALVPGGPGCAWSRRTAMQWASSWSPSSTGRVRSPTCGACWSTGSISAGGSRHGCSDCWSTSAVSRVARSCWCRGPRAGAHRVRSTSPMGSSRPAAWSTARPRPGCRWVECGQGGIRPSSANPRWADNVLRATRVPAGAPARCTAHALP
jgi:RimJ/RimL family protein N-acetyltransferase